MSISPGSRTPISWRSNDRKSIRPRFCRAESVRREPVRKCSPNAHNQSYVHAGPSPIEKTAIQADISGNGEFSHSLDPERTVNPLLSGRSTDRKANPGAVPLVT